MKFVKTRFAIFKSLTLLLLAFMPHDSFSQERDVLSVFSDQVDAFNKADVDRLVSNVSDDFKYFYISSDELTLEVQGKDKFRKSMESYFSRGRKVVSKIECYLIEKNRISFREVVSHKNQKGETVSSSALGIYEIRNGKITRSWYFVD